MLIGTRGTTLLLLLPLIKMNYQLNYQSKSQAIQSISELSDTYGCDCVLSAILTAMEGDTVRQHLEWLKDERDNGGL